MSTESFFGLLCALYAREEALWAGTAMFIERLTLTNFRCFGAETNIDLTPGLTTFIGANGSGKTAVMQALQRLFGITGDQRHIRRQDFYVPADEAVAPLQRHFSL